MTGKFNKFRQVNHLSISQGWDKIWRVRTTEKPHTVMHEGPTQGECYLWAHEQRKTAKKQPVWVPVELMYLRDNYGMMPADKIAEHLGRSRDALKIICVRKLKINQRSNIYSARAVAEELGVG